MRQQRLVIAGATLLAATLAMSSCGTRADENPGGTGSTTEKVAKIGLIAPLSGDLSAVGIGMRNSAELAVKQANEKKTIPGWTLELDAQDDQGKPDPGKNAATKLAGDDEVVAVVGTLNSSVAQSVQPVLNSAKIAQISPSNTNPTLTMGADPANPKRAYPGYFRTCTTDLVQGPFAAKYLLGAGIKKVATVHDKKAYGQGLVAAFTDSFKAGGGEIVFASTVNPEDKDFSAVVSKVKSASPDAVYFGGEYPVAGPFSQQAKAAGLTVPLMGGDGMQAAGYLQLAGKSGEGDLGTSVGAPPEELPSAKQFIADYKAGNFKEAYGPYGALSYDATNSIINGLKTSLASAENGKAARAATIEAIQQGTIDGATGPVAFDEFGDTKTKILTVWKVEKNAWVAIKSGT